MAVVNRATAQAAADVIRDETTAQANTALRVGGLFRDLADSLVFGPILNADIATAAAIAVTKLAPGAANTVLQSDGTTNSFAQIANPHVASNAAIAGTKIAPNFGSQNVATTGVYSAEASPAQTGSFRGGVAASLYGRTAGGVDKAGVIVDTANNRVDFGLSSGTAASGTSRVGALTDISFRVAGDQRLLLDSLKLWANINEILVFPNQTSFGISQQRRTSTGVAADLAFRAQGAAASTNDNGGNVLIAGGGRAGTGLRGAVRLRFNANADTDATFETMVEIAEVAAGRRALALCFAADVTTTQLPANTGDRVAWLANCATAPTANAVGGVLVYSQLVSAVNELRVWSDGDYTQLAPNVTISPTHKITLRAGTPSTAGPANAFIEFAREGGGTSSSIGQSTGNALAITGSDGVNISGLSSGANVFIGAGSAATAQLGAGSAVEILVGATARIRADATGLGFFNVTPVARPTVSGSRGGNAALASLLTGLANLGLVTDSSSA